MCWIRLTICGLDIIGHCMTHHLTIGRFLIIDYGFLRNNVFFNYKIKTAGSGISILKVLSCCKWPRSRELLISDTKNLISSVDIIYLKSHLDIFFDEFKEQILAVCNHSNFLQLTNFICWLQLLFEMFYQRLCQFQWFQAVRTPSQQL